MALGERSSAVSAKRRSPPIKGKLVAARVVRYVLITHDLVLDVAGRCRTSALGAVAEIQARRAHE
jgi:hypothetical protein